MSRKQMVRQLLSTSLLFAGACSHFHRGTQVSARPAAAPVAAPVAAPKRVAAPVRPVKGPTDANIAAILLAANNTDISYGRIATSRAQTPAVKEYASQMIVDHAGVNRIVNDLLTRMMLNPEDNTASLEFRDESAAKRDQLHEATPRGFDASYMLNEVSYHTKLLASIDNTLLPSARSPEIRQLLTSLRPAVAAHLAHAEQVQAGLGAR